MNIASRVLYALLAAGLAPLGAAVSAQSIGGVPFAEIDINGDGYLDAAELMAAFDAAGLNVLSRDLSGDGLVTRDELRTSRQYARRDAADERTGSRETPEPPPAQDAASSRTELAAAGRRTGAAADAGDGNNGAGNDSRGPQGNAAGQGQGGGNSGANRAGGQGGSPPGRPLEVGRSAAQR